MPPQVNPEPGKTDLGDKEIEVVETKEHGPRAG
jgi:hypothetical protein